MKKYFLENKLLTIFYFLGSFGYGFIFGKEGFVEGLIQIGKVFSILTRTSAYDSFSNGFFTAIGAAFAFILLLYSYYLIEKMELESLLKIIPKMIQDFDKLLGDLNKIEKDSDMLWEKIDKIVTLEISQQNSLLFQKEKILKLKEKYKEISVVINNETDFLKTKLENEKEISFLIMIHEFVGKKHFGGTLLNNFRHEVNNHGETIVKKIRDAEVLLNKMKLSIEEELGI